MRRALFLFVMTLPAAAQTLMIGSAAIPALAGYYSVAPGSLIVAIPNAANNPQLGTDLSSIQLTMQPRSGGAVLPATVVSMGLGQVLAVVPAGVPLGWTTVTMTITTKGSQASLTGSVYVSRSSFGLFSTGTFGAGPAIAQNVGDNGVPSLNQLTGPALPGQYVTLWGTGLGDFTAADVAVTMYDTVVQPSFAGHAPGQAGIDQVNFRVPDGVPGGCYVPVTVTVGGVDVSNQATLSTSRTAGTVCAHPLGLSSAQLTTLDQGGTVMTGTLWASTSAYSDGNTGAFNRYESGGFYVRSANAALAFTGPMTPPLAAPSCSLVGEPFAGIIFGSFSQLTFGDAGPSMTLTSPGQTQVTMAKTNDTYSKTFDPSPGAPSLSALGPPFFSSGVWMLSAPGGADIPAFQQAFTLPPPLHWTNRDTLGKIDRSTDLTIQWDGQGYAPTDTVAVLLDGSVPQGTTLPSGTYSGVYCRGAAQAGKLVIGREWLQKIVATFPGMSSGLDVSISSDASRPTVFTVPLKAGGNAPVAVSRTSGETLPVVIQ